MVVGDCDSDDSGDSDDSWGCTKSKETDTMPQPLVVGPIFNCIVATLPLPAENARERSPKQSAKNFFSSQSIDELMCSVHTTGSTPWRTSGTCFEHAATKTTKTKRQLWKNYASIEGPVTQSATLNMVLVGLDRSEDLMAQRGPADLRRHLRVLNEIEGCLSCAAVTPECKRLQCGQCRDRVLEFLELRVYHSRDEPEGNVLYILLEIVRRLSVEPGKQRRSKLSSEDAVMLRAMLVFALYKAGTCPVAFQALHGDGHTASVRNMDFAQVRDVVQTIGPLDPGVRGFLMAVVGPPQLRGDVPGRAPPDVADFLGLSLLLEAILNGHHQGLTTQALPCAPGAFLKVLAECDVSCDFLSPALRVLGSWRQEQSSGSHRAGAMEFVSSVFGILLSPGDASSAFAALACDTLCFVLLLLCEARHDDMDAHKEALLSCIQTECLKHALSPAARFALEQGISAEKFAPSVVKQLIVAIGISVPCSDWEKEDQVRSKKKQKR